MSYGFDRGLATVRPAQSDCAVLSPANSRSLADPKAALIELASRSQSRDVKLRVAPPSGSTARVGREYNDCLCEFIDSAWSPDTARKHSESLDRAIQRLSGFRPEW